jgi:hypothetical protein
MVLVFLIMLNMLLAIIMDAYASVKEKSQSSESLYAQFWALTQEVKHAKEKASTWKAAVKDTMAKKDPKSLELVFLALEERQLEKGEEFVSVQILEEIGVPKDHAEELFQEIVRFASVRKGGQNQGDDAAADDADAEKALEDDELEMAKLEEEYHRNQELESLAQLAGRMDKMERSMQTMQQETEKANTELLKRLDNLINGGKMSASKSPPRAPVPPPKSGHAIKSPIKNGRRPLPPHTLPGVPDGESHGENARRGNSPSSNRSVPNANRNGVSGHAGRVLDL